MNRHDADSSIDHNTAAASMLREFADAVAEEPGNALLTEVMRKAADEIDALRAPPSQRDVEKLRAHFESIRGDLFLHGLGELDFQTAYESVLRELRQIEELVGA